MTCHKTDHLGNNWVSCDECKDWILYENSRLKSAFESLNKTKEAFTCRACLAEARLLKLEELTNKIDTTASEAKAALDTGSRLWADVVKETNFVKEEVKKTALAVTTNRNVDGNLTAPQLRQAADEAADVKRRERNVIVTGMVEGPNDARDLIEYARTCHTLLREDDIEAIDRLGRPGPQPRILRVKLYSALKRKNLLLMRPDEATSSSSRIIYIRPDLTKNQMELDKKLRFDLAIAGKDRFMIRRGMIVPRSTSDSIQRELDEAGRLRGGDRQERAEVEASLHSSSTGTKGKQLATAARTFYKKSKTDLDHVGSSIPPPTLLATAPAPPLPPTQPSNSIPSPPTQPSTITPPAPAQPSTAPPGPAHPLTTSPAPPTQPSSPAPAPAQPVATTPAPPTRPLTTTPASAHPSTITPDAPTHPSTPTPAPLTHPSSTKLAAPTHPSVTTTAPSTQPSVSTPAPPTNFSSTTPAPSVHPSSITPAAQGNEDPDNFKQSIDTVPQRREHNVSAVPIKTGKSSPRMSTKKNSLASSSKNSDKSVPKSKTTESTYGTRGTVKSRSKTIDKA